AKIGASRRDQRLGLRQGESVGNRLRRAGQFGRKTVALIGVEHRELLHKRDRVWLVAVALGPGALVVGHEAVRLDYGRAVLALADVSAEPQCLAECEPRLGAEAMLDHRAPEDQHINSRIWPLRRGVLGHAEGSLRRPRAPRP